MSDVLDVGRTVRTKEILAPEGVPLRFEIASPGGRIWGFFLDGILIGLALLGLWLLALMIFAAVGLADGWVLSVFVILVFLVRNFYFIGFEIRGSGATPGKRRAGTRVIDRRGRPLTSEAIFVRNLTRELEIFLPIAILSDSHTLLGGSEVARVFAAAGLVVMALLPLFNRDRLRVGDLIAGTIVVREPRPVLARDVSATRPRATSYAFTPEQLDIYGIFELQVLEDVLRQRGPAALDARRVVAKKIFEKIGWKGDFRDLRVSTFLREFYAAQRARLEQKMLFGERRERKQSGASRRRRPR